MYIEAVKKLILVSAVQTCVDLRSSENSGDYLYNSVVDIRVNPISDYSPLLKIKSLKKVLCMQDQLPDIEAACKDAEFECVVLDQ